MDDNDVAPYGEGTADPDFGDPGGVDPLAGEPVLSERGRLLPALLAGAGVALLGIVAWALSFVILEHDYPGIAVLIGLLVGYVVRGVAKRSTFGIRVAAVLITLIAIAVGIVVGEIAYTSSEYKLPFLSTLWRTRENWWPTITHRTTLQYAVYAASLLIAFLAAGPSQKTARSTAAAEPDEAPPAPVEPAADPE